MINKIIFFSGPTCNKLRTYESVPSLERLKREIITDVFKNTITNPSLTIITEKEGLKLHLKVDTEEELENALQSMNDPKSIEIKVEQQGADSVITLPDSPETTPSSLILTPSPEMTPLNRGSLIPVEYRTIGSFSRAPIEMPKLNAKVVRHITMPDDNNHIYPGVKFTKIWCLSNSGDLKWPQTVVALFVSNLTGNKMGAKDATEVNYATRLEPGQETNICVEMEAPDAPGEYTGFWKLSDVDGKKFGQRFRARIHVDALPRKEILLDDSQEVAKKIDHLKRLFPDIHTRFLTHFDIDFRNEKGVQSILDGTQFTMEEIICTLSETYHSLLIRDSLT